MQYKCKNYRPNNPPRQLPGACLPHVGQVIADLYDKNGEFHRSAVVADVGASGLTAAQRYCDEQNAASAEESPDFDQWDSDDYDVEAMKIDHSNGNFTTDRAEDYRHDNIVRESLANGQFEQARDQCRQFGLDYIDFRRELVE